MGAGPMSHLSPLTTSFSLLIASPLPPLMHACMHACIYTHARTRCVSAVPCGVARAVGCVFAELVTGKATFACRQEQPEQQFMYILKHLGTPSSAEVKNMHTEAALLSRVDVSSKVRGISWYELLDLAEGGDCAGELMSMATAAVSAADGVLSLGGDADGASGDAA